MADLPGIFVNILGPVFLLVALGAVLAKKVALDAQTLAKLSYWLLGPFFVFDILASADLEPGLVLRMVGAIVVTMVAVGVAVAGVSRMLGRSRPVASAGVLTSIFGNVGNFGLAIVAFTFGESALPLAGIALLTINIIGLIVGVGAATSLSAPPWRSVRAALTAPMTLAVPPAVLVNVTNWDMPLWLDRPVSLLAGALIPTMLVTLGVQIAAMQRPRFDADVGVPLIAKLVAAPAVAWLAAGLLGLSGVPAGVVIVQSAMPAAVFTALIALEHDLLPDLTTTIVLTGTLASIATLPVVIALVS